MKTEKMNFIYIFQIHKSFTLPMQKADYGPRTWSQEKLKMRSRLATAVTLVFLPVIIFLFAIGWSLYFLGLSEKPTKARRKPLDDGITITTTIEEESLQECQS